MQTPDDQGIETVRRDNCLLVRNVVTTSLEKILMDKDVEGAQAYVRNTISDLLMNRMDLSLLVITKVPPRSACICRMGSMPSVCLVSSKSDSRHTLYCLVVL